MSANGITPRCHVPWQQLVIDATGSVAPCCYWGAYENVNPPIGNINDNTIEEIWNNQRFQQLRRGMASGDLVLAGCDRCYALQQGMTLGLEYDESCEAEEAGAQTVYANNIAVLKEEMAAGQEILSAQPTVVSYTPSHRCNIRCIHCYQEATRTAEIARERAAEEIVALAPYLTRIIAGGGEPFLLPIWGKFLEKFDLSKNPYLDFATSTNATIVTDKVLAGLSRFKNLTMNVSLDGVREVYDRVRVGASFVEVRDNIRKLKALVDAKSTRSTIGCTMCVMKSTIHDLPNFIKFCTDEGVRWGISPVITMPPDESLRCFNDPVQDMRGWDQAIIAAKALLDPFWWPHFDLLRQQIPFDVAGLPHCRVTVSLPQSIVAEYRRQYPGQTLVAYIYKFDEAVPAAPYWAPVDGLELEVSLPHGSYCFNIATKWVDLPYWDGLRFSVDGNVRTTAFRP